MNTQESLQHQDVNNLLTIFAIMACILPIYYGFKKSKRQGIINSGIVSLVLYGYFTIPVIRTIVLVLFVAYIVYGVIGGVIKNVF